MKPIRLFSSDLDGTLAGDRAGSLAFARQWAALPDAVRPLLVYNSGRLVDDILAFTAAQSLPPADFIIGGVGTLVHSETWPDLASDYATNLGTGFDATQIEAAFSGLEGLSRQPDEYQHGLKSSWHLWDASVEAIHALELHLRDAGHPVRLVYSSNRDLDVLPERADKGQALTWLCQELGIGLDEVLVAGDTGNDRAMFMLEGVRGILPGNALPELASLAHARPAMVQSRQACALGVLEGLEHFGILRPTNA